jgi:hypothetical protein
MAVRVQLQALAALPRTERASGTHWRGHWVDPRSGLTPWPESESELDLPRDRLMSAKLVPIYAERVPRAQCDGSLWLSRPEPLLFLPSSSSIVLTRLSGPRPRPTTSQKIW